MKRILAKLVHAFWLNPVTWVGHGLQGVLIALYFYLRKPEPLEAALLVTAYHFLVRELEGIIKNWNVNAEKFEDGVMDLITPFVGITVVYTVIKVVELLS